MRDRLIRFLSSGHSFSDDQYEIKLKFILFNLLIIFHSFAAILGMTYRLLEHNYLYFGINLIFLIFAFISYWITRRTPQSIEILTWIMILFAAPVITLYYYKNLNPVSGTSWFILLLFVSYVFKGFRVSFLIFILSLIVIYLIGYMQRGYSWSEISLGLIPMGTLTLILYAFHQFYLRLTQSIQAEKKRYAHLARYDLLTQIPNRNAFKDYLDKIGSRQNDTEHLVVLFLDLDHFKEINDRHGHAVGDQVLQIVVQRLKNQVRRSDFLARYGGDEFVLALHHINDGKSIHTIVNNILTAMRRPIQLEDHTFEISASIGIAIAPRDSTQTETLIHYADQAMYQAKKKGGDGYAFYRDLTVEAPSE